MIRQNFGSLGSLYGMIATNLTVFVAWLGA